MLGARYAAARTLPEKATGTWYAGRLVDGETVATNKKLPMLIDHQGATRIT
jgi:hypothetical protein